jgi:inner membrane protein involved in colicin E2 resistance
VSIFQLLGSLALTGGLALLLFYLISLSFSERISCIFNQNSISSFASAIKSVLIFMDAAALWNQLAFD